MKLLNPDFFRDEKKESYTIELTPSKFAERTLTIDTGQPFRLGQERQYWYAIYDVYNPFLVLVASRQAEKSTFIRNSILATLLTNRNDIALYCTALFSHLKEFSVRKIDRVIRANPALQKLAFGKNVTYNLTDKYFTNGSALHLRAIGTRPESARGNPARSIFFDEVQLIESDSIAVAMEQTQSYAERSNYKFTGTPLTRNNYLSRLFKKSLQYEWIITCSHCRKENPPLGMQHIDSTKPFLFCVFCGKEMSPQNGRWVAQNPAGTYTGFRICRLMTHTCRWRTEAQDGVLDKYDGPNAYPEYRFLNEVLGLPAETGSAPISAADLYSIAGDLDMIDPNKPPEWLIKTLSIGTMDWAWNSKTRGQSFTIFAIWVILNSKYTCIYAKRFIGPQYHDPQVVLDEIARHIRKTACAFIGTDFGIGHKENIRLRPMVQPTKVFEIMYAGHSSHLEYNQAENRYHVGRTESLDLVFAGLQQGRFAVPKLEQSKPFLDDILNVFTETDPTNRRVKYDHDGPDDFLHLMNYAKLIFHQMQY